MADSQDDKASQGQSLELEAKKDLTPGGPAGDTALADILSVHSNTEYKLYRRRFVGIVALVRSGYSKHCWRHALAVVRPYREQHGVRLWYYSRRSQLARKYRRVHISALCAAGKSRDPVHNWPLKLLQIPEIIRRYGFRRCCDIGAVCMVVSAWIRYAGTPRSLSPGGAYALLIVAQIFSAIAQPIYQVVGPKYSETWFSLEGRVTATMVLAIANPVGGALGQLLSPIVGTTRQSILVLAIISTVAAPFVFLISSAPPTPPTYAASKDPPGMVSLLRVMSGKSRPSDPPMSGRERLDFVIIFCIFGALAAAINVFGVLTAEILQPVGYSSDTAGFMGATLLLSGVVAAIATAPLFDRVFTSHLAITAKVLVPILAVVWLSLIWAVKPNNTGALYALCAIIGITSVTMLPVALELAVEVTRNAEGSSALLWFACNGLAIIFILVEGALRATPSANPPLNMRKALIFNGAFIMIVASSVFFLRGKQMRKVLDRQRLERAQVRANEVPLATAPST
ncbi:MFS general substrate transporter [Mycena chlorophos]|uniref:MFS general substrate transporter n=1 Tax=Mycena chlorophos TaxID=658473 RepID=A0A8H6VY93_MYCCL|nr:MFS general substrate transporter [Mycena chlorophos]